jgi:hypothetical protein
MATPVNIVVSSSVTQPWHDGECRAYCRKTRTLERIYRRSHLPADCRAWSTALLDKRELFAAKEQAYWTTRLQECSGNSKLFWCCLNSVLLRDYVSTPNNSTLTAQVLADFFISKVVKVRASSQHCPPANFSGPSPASLNNFRSCSLDEVRRVITQSPQKFSQLDLLPHSLLMKSLDHLLPFLLLLCNSSLSSGTLPTSEESALITSIMKKHDLDLDSASSYRPVSNLTFVSKLIERLVCSQLTTYLLNHHLMPSQQSAYRPSLNRDCNA